MREEEKRGRGGARKRFFVGAVLTALVACEELSAGESPWFVNGRAGQASVDWSYGPATFGWDVDDEDATAVVEVGFLFHRHFAVEAGVRDLGRHRGAPRPCPAGELCPLTLGAGALLPVGEIEASLRAATLALAPRWPIGDRFALVGKLGLVRWEAQIEAAGRALDDERSHDELLWGGGAELRFASGFGLLAAYEAGGPFESATVGVSWRF